jgi:hypothetical protein
MDILEHENQFKKKLQMVEKENQDLMNKINEYVRCIEAVREQFTDVQSKLNIGSSFFNINFDNTVFISFEKTNLECENRFKEIIQRKEKENEDLMNKINEYERSVQAYRQKQIEF